MAPETSDGRPAEDRLPIASLVKSLRVLEELGMAKGTASVGDLIERTELQRTTVQRILRTLHAERYIDRTGRGEYAVAPRAFVLGALLTNGSHLAVAVGPLLRRLQRETGEAVHAAVLDGTDVVCVFHVPADKLLAFNFPIGARVPAYASTLGRTILANLPSDQAMEILRMSDRRALTGRTRTSLRDLGRELDRVREQGFAVARGEIEAGIWSVAGPLLGPTGEALAAINVVVPATEADETPDGLVQPLLAAADELSRKLGWSPKGPGSPT